jgi:hypothetical protein
MSRIINNWLIGRKNKNKWENYEPNKKKVKKKIKQKIETIKNRVKRLKGKK